MSDLFLILNKNYLNLKNWKGPYLIYPDSVWGYTSVYSEQRESNKFGVICSGWDQRIQHFERIEGDDIGFFMTYDDLNK